MFWYIVITHQLRFLCIASENLIVVYLILLALWDHIYLTRPYFSLRESFGVLSATNTVYSLTPSKNHFYWENCLCTLTLVIASLGQYLVLPVLNDSSSYLSGTLSAMWSLAEFTWDWNGFQQPPSQTDWIRSIFIDNSRIKGPLPFNLIHTHSSSFCVFRFFSSIPDSRTKTKQCPQQAYCLSSLSKRMAYQWVIYYWCL